MQQSKQLRIISFVAVTIILAVLLIVGFRAKAIFDNAETSAELQEQPVAILTSDVVADQSWGSLAYKGKLKVEEQFPVQVELVSELDTEIERKAAIREAIDRGVNLIIGHGREFSGVFNLLALENPDVRFVTLHGEPGAANYTVYTFDQGEIEYFAALAASIITQSGKVGILDPFEARARNPEFETGLKHYKPEAQFQYEVVNSRDNGKKALELTKKLIDSGVDVIYSKGNSYNREVINYAKDNGVYVIGYLDDQSYMAKETVLTSVLNDVPQAYVAIIKDYFSETGIPSGTVMLDEDDGVYRLSPLGPMFTGKEKNFIESEMKKYKDGEITFQQPE